MAVRTFDRYSTLTFLPVSVCPLLKCTVAIHVPKWQNTTDGVEYKTLQYLTITRRDGAKTFFRDRDICQDTGAKTWDEPRHFGLGWDKTRHETSFKCSRHEALRDTGSKTGDRQRLDWDEIKTLLKCLRLRLPKYSYQNTNNNNNHKDNRLLPV